MGKMTLTTEELDKIIKEAVTRQYIFSREILQMVTTKH